MNDAATAFRLGGVQCDTLTVPELLSDVRSMLADATQQPRAILCVNAHIHNLARRDPSLLECLARARVVAIDGVSVVWAGRMLGAPVRERCNMTEAFRAFLDDPDAPESRAIVIGGADGLAERAGEAISSRSRCRVVAAHSGFLEDSAYPDLLADAGDVDFVLAGMGSPRSEKLLTDLVPRILPGAIGWHIGGGTIEFLSGVRKEAPVILRRSGLQWLYRLCKEPRRMWKRYLVGNPVFVWHTLRESLKARTP